MQLKNVRSPGEKVGGIFYFGRMLDKIRAQANGELPDEYQPNLGRGFDAQCTRFLQVDYEELQKKVLSGLNDEDVLAWCFESGRAPAEHEIHAWNEFMRKYGWRDEASETLARRKREGGFENRAEIETMFQFIDADEGRPVRA